MKSTSFDVIVLIVIGLMFFGAASIGLKLFGEGANAGLVGGLLFTVVLVLFLNALQKNKK